MEYRGPKTDHAKTLSGATGKMLLREWHAYKRRQLEEGGSLPPPASAHGRPGLNAETFKTPSEEPPASEEAAKQRLSAKSMPATRHTAGDQERPEAANGGKVADAAVAAEVQSTEEAAPTVGSNANGETEDSVATELPLRRQVLRQISRSSSSNQLHRARPNLRRPSFLEDYSDGFDAGVPGSPSAEP